MVGLISLIIIWIWVMYEMWRAPMMDDNGNIIKPTKTLKDLFK